VLRHGELALVSAAVQSGQGCAGEPFPVAGDDFRSGGSDRRADSSRGRADDAVATDLHDAHCKRVARAAQGIYWPTISLRLAARTYMVVETSRRFGGGLHGPDTSAGRIALEATGDPHRPGTCAVSV